MGVMVNKGKEWTFNTVADILIALKGGQIHGIIDEN